MTQTRKTDWDASTPQVITNAYGRVIGTLQPRITGRVLAASAGIQAHSKPGYLSRVSLYAGDAAIEHFARHWSANTGRYYPYSA